MRKWCLSPYHPLLSSTIPLPSLYHPSTVPLPSLYHPSVPLPSLYHPSAIPLPSLYHKNPPSTILPSLYRPSTTLYHPLPPSATLCRPSTIPLPSLYTRTTLSVSSLLSDMLRCLMVTQSVYQPEEAFVLEKDTDELIILCWKSSCTVLTVATLRLSALKLKLHRTSYRLNCIFSSLSMICCTNDTHL